MIVVPQTRERLGEPSGEGESITDWWFRCLQLLELVQLGQSLEEQPDQC